MKQLEKGQSVTVSSNAPFHKERKGIVFYPKAGPDGNTVVLSETSDKNKTVLFAVARQHIF